jgi:hypothetical protein
MTFIAEESWRIKFLLHEGYSENYSIKYSEVGKKLQIFLLAIETEESI